MGITGFSPNKWRRQMTHRKHYEGMEKEMCVVPSYDSQYLGKSELTSISVYQSASRRAQIFSSGSQHTLEPSTISTRRSHCAIVLWIDFSSALCVDRDTLFLKISARFSGVMAASFSLASLALIIEIKIRNKAHVLYPRHKNLPENMYFL